MILDVFLRDCGSGGQRVLLEVLKMPVDMGHCITDPFEARGEGAKHCTRLSAKKLRPVLWVGLGDRTRRGKIGSWN